MSNAIVGNSRVNLSDTVSAFAPCSCAYLCCANLQQEGGPAARSGESSSKCSGCMVCRYW